MSAGLTRLSVKPVQRTALAARFFHRLERVGLGLRRLARPLRMDELEYLDDLGSLLLPHLSEDASILRSPSANSSPVD